jgi:NTP pyrophosphatase (non-canonical NTP hydrolase)
VFEKGVSGKYRVVRFNNSGRHLRRWVSAESKLGLLAVVDGKTLKEKRSETGSGTSTDSVEAQEALEASAVVRKLAEAVEDEVHDLLTDGVVAARLVGGGILLARNDLLRVVELAVGAGADLVAHGGLKIDVHAARHVLAGAGLREEGVERIIATTDGLVRRHLAIRLDAVLKAVELPAGVARLDAALANVDGDNLTHFEKKRRK